MSTLGRTLKNFMRAGPASSWRQLQFIGDTKYGALIGTDSVGNKYFENNDEIYGRERWVEYASNDPDPAQITPDWHMWLNKFVQEPPTEMNIEPKKFFGEPTPNFTGTRNAYVPYNTVRPKYNAWEPQVKSRD
ncbi:hypothetical protein VKS41_000483 [Umbelopsis sp. WA50703]